MSLNVSDDLLAQAEAGEVSPAAFLDTVRDSLPYAYAMVERLSSDLKAGRAADGAPFADNTIPPDTEAERGQLLRALASNSIRASLESHFDVTLAFQNCHRLAAFPAGSKDTTAYRVFTSQRAQLLNQSPALRNC